MVYACDRLRHSIVVGILRPKSEIEICSLQACRELRRMPARTPIGAYGAQPAASVGNEPKAYRFIACATERRLEHGAHQVVVQKRRTQGELGLFQPEAAKEVPGRLPKCGKGERMTRGDLRIGTVSSLNGRADFG